jgi:hypothetical protein
MYRNGDLWRIVDMGRAKRVYVTLFGQSVGLFTRREQEVAGSPLGRGTIVGSFSFSQATGKVFSPEYAIYSKF